MDKDSTNDIPFHVDNELVYDNEGFLVDFDSWTPQWAEQMARQLGLEKLTDAHWNIINYLRFFYKDWSKAPLAKQIKAETGISLLQIEKLFPEGIRLGARRIAGLPNPRTCL